MAVYFIQATNNRLIKIGTTCSLAERLKTLTREAGSELRVLGVVEGSHPEERALHRHFSHLRVIQEWFEPADEILKFIASEGSEWDPAGDVVQATVKMDVDVIDECRIAAAHKGQTLAEYLSESMRVVAAKDIDEALAKRAAKGKPGKGKDAH